MDIALDGTFYHLRRHVGQGGTSYRSMYSGAKPIVEYLNGSLSKEYVYSGSTLLATIAGGAATYHHPDHLSNRVETDASGAPVRTFGHLPYGETWYEPTGTDKFKFTSYESDSGTGETGLNYAAFRQHSPGLGRFMSADLLAGNLGAPQSLNRYAYAMNDPVNLVDPLGLATMSMWFCTPLMREIWWTGDGEPAHIGKVIDSCELVPIVPFADGNGGGGGGAPGGDDKVKKARIAALAKCLEQLFSVKLSSFDESAKGHNGSFSGATTNGQQLSFANDSTTFSTANLNRLFFGNDKPPAGRDNITGLTLSGISLVGFGFPGGSSWNPFRAFSVSTSYTANDIVGVAFWDNQVHELGHQIAGTLGKEKLGEEVYGGKLQDCIARELAKH